MEFLLEMVEYLLFTCLSHGLPINSIPKGNNTGDFLYMGERRKLISAQCLHSIGTALSLATLEESPLIY